MIFRNSYYFIYQSQHSINYEFQQILQQPGPQDHLRRKQTAQGRHHPQGPANQPSPQTN